MSGQSGLASLGTSSETFTSDSSSGTSSISVSTGPSTMTWSEPEPTDIAPESETTSSESDPSEPEYFSEESLADTIQPSEGSIGPPAVVCDLPVPVASPNAYSAEAQSSHSDDLEAQVDALAEQIQQIPDPNALEFEWPPLAVAEDLPMEPVPDDGVDFDQIYEQWAQQTFQAPENLQHEHMGQDPIPEPLVGEADLQPIGGPVHPIPTEPTGSIPGADQPSSDMVGIQDFADSRLPIPHECYGEFCAFCIPGETPRRGEPVSLTPLRTSLINLERAEQRMRENWYIETWLENQPETFDPLPEHVEGSGIEHVSDPCPLCGGTQSSALGCQCMIASSSSTPAIVRPSVSAAVPAPELGLMVDQYGYIVPPMPGPCGFVDRRDTHGWTARHYSRHLPLHQLPFFPLGHLQDWPARSVVHLVPSVGIDGIGPVRGFLSFPWYVYVHVKYDI